ncbi:HEPN domain-containing protein [Salinarimonas soli]|uniref:RiboL-PSP-HEPN domain-containing protein n=1 Tax=Salinarimonas soli TaxID=1638099 RepID=A0A5B2VBH9_9HYPH|nr:HEPN domain-containing protein [Salinarimonas soli]KAA2236431.1 hypothetical protein F0L46_14915 [Salinarimonas soli]
MKSAYNVFCANLDRVRAIHALHLVFSNSVTSVVDLSDILRSEMVLIVSALDHFVHEITRTGMLEIWAGARAPAGTFENFTLTMTSAQQIKAGASGESLLEVEIRNRHGHLSFQHPDKIADAIRNFSSVKLWDGVSTILGRTPQDVKAQLKLIVERRNKIAHEADIDPSFPGQRWPITRADVEDALSFVSDLGRVILQVVK